MFYSTKKLRIEKAPINNKTNKNKRKEFVEKLDEHVAMGGMIIYQDETNFTLYLPRGGHPWVSALSSNSHLRRGKNLRIQGGVSTLTGIVLLRTHEGPITEEENTRFVADLFVAALRTEEYQDLPATNKMVIVTDNAPAHTCVETLAREWLVSDGILNGASYVSGRIAQC
ncbi:LOW QUALITY PROTEIN: Transposase [Phytophthora megakarya]|uniref:Transposase n=1 Tax=Phytophthora megakarya TaxID=4795 RepID=A0A225UWW6_9STRA|nr:LOW QUALITY PROTEIN: Transposase [Phytophthora megakarya]